jgi:hypothetical protein
VESHRPFKEREDEKRKRGRGHSEVKDFQSTVAVQERAIGWHGKCPVSGSSQTKFS